MSTITNNPLLKGIRGMLGKILVFREVRGKVVVSNRPKKRKTPTPHQLKTKEKFMRGVHYAKAQMKDPQAKALYTAGITERKFHAYMVALTDFLTPPTIHEVNCMQYSGTAGDSIFATVTDDFQVESVEVTIVDAKGITVEQGQAIALPDTHAAWEYKATVGVIEIKGVRIRVSARDRADNVTVMERGL